MMEKTMYKWITLDEEGEVVSFGIEDSPIEFDVNKLHPRLNYFGDRDMCEVQKFLDKHYGHLFLLFNYKEVEIDFKELLKY